MQKPIFRDVWGLSAHNENYAGAFPSGFIKKLKRRWWGQKRLWLFSGSFKDKGGTTVDLNSAVYPDYCCDCEKLPFKDNTYDFVMLDPPYSKYEAKELYDMKYCSIVKVMNEAARVCMPGGCVILLHRLTPWCHPKENQKKLLKPVAVVGVYTIAGYTNMRALTVWRKQGTLLDSIERLHGNTKGNIANLSDK